MMIQAGPGPRFIPAIATLRSRRLTSDGLNPFLPHQRRLTAETQSRREIHLLVTLEDARSLHLFIDGLRDERHDPSRFSALGKIANTTKGARGLLPGSRRTL